VITIKNPEVHCAKSAVESTCNLNMILTIFVMLFESNMSCSVSTRSEKSMPGITFIEEEVKKHDPEARLQSSKVTKNYIHLFIPHYQHLYP
jgi:hypothetical protein